MDVLKFAWIYTFIFVEGVKNIHGYGVPCYNYEVMVCGDVNNGNAWSICQPKTPGVRRILSAQLDIRYENRYCRRYGRPENFGLSESGRSMWTVGWCYGTFFLCLELDSEISDERLGGDNSFGGGSSTTDLNGLDKTTHQTHDKTTTQTTTESMTSINDAITTEISYKEHFIVQTGPLETDDYVTNEEYFDVNLLPANNSSLNTSHVEEHSMGNSSDLDPRLKFWLIFAIVSGGIIIVILIAVIAFLTMQCCDSNTDEEESLNSKPKKSASKKYFRPQKWSTSALVTSEPEYCTDVYDFIPAAKVRQTASIRREYEISEKQKAKQQRDESHENTITEVDDNSEVPSGSLSKHNSTKSNAYFILIPHARDDSSLKSDCNSIRTNTHLTEHIYDHLVHTPTVLISDSSTYHHLNFKRDLTIDDETTNTEEKQNDQKVLTSHKIIDKEEHKSIHSEENKKEKPEDTDKFKKDLSCDNEESKKSLNDKTNLSHDEKSAKAGDNQNNQKELPTVKNSATLDHILKHAKGVTRDETNAELDHNQNNRYLTDNEDIAESDRILTNTHGSQS